MAQSFFVKPSRVLIPEGLHLVVGTKVALSALSVNIEQF